MENYSKRLEIRVPQGDVNPLDFTHPPRDSTGKADSKNALAADTALSKFLNAGAVIFDCFGCGTYLFFNTLLCLRLLPSPHRCDTLAIGFPSPPSGWVWALLTSCVISILMLTLPSGSRICLAHNKAVDSTPYGTPNFDSNEIETQ